MRRSHGGRRTPVCGSAGELGERVAPSGGQSEARPPVRLGVRVVAKCGCQTLGGKDKGESTSPSPPGPLWPPSLPGQPPSCIARHSRLWVVISHPSLLASRPLSVHRAPLGISTSGPLPQLSPRPGVPVLPSSTWLRPPGPSLVPPPPGSLSALARRGLSLPRMASSSPRSQHSVCAQHSLRAAQAQWVGSQWA